MYTYLLTYIKIQGEVISNAIVQMLQFYSNNLPIKYRRSYFCCVLYPRQWVGGFKTLRTVGAKAMGGRRECAQDSGRTRWVAQDSGRGLS